MPLKLNSILGQVSNRNSKFLKCPKIYAKVIGKFFDYYVMAVSFFANPLWLFTKQTDRL